MEIRPSAGPGRMMGFPSPAFCVMDYRGTRPWIPRKALQSGVAHNTLSHRLCMPLIPADKGCQDRPGCEIRRNNRQKGQKQ